MMYRYIIYGLGVHSAFPLWAGSAADDVPADVTVRWGNASIPWPDAGTGLVLEELEDEIRLTWPFIAHIRIRAGSEIVVARGPDAEEDHLRHLVGGFALGLLLHQRRVLTLHASATCVDGYAIIFAGAKRCGKSTLAAAMQRRGHDILTDDIAAIELSSERLPCLLRGPLSLNLWPEAAVHLGQDAGAWPRSSPFNDKRVQRLERSSRPDCPPIRCVFVLHTLQNDDRPTIGPPLLGMEVFVELIRHSHALRILRAPRSVLWYSRQCARLACTVPVLRLPRRWSLNRLPELVRQIEEYAAHPITAGTVHA